MRQHVKVFLCSMLAAICILSQTGCGGKEPVSDSTFLLNTTCTVTILAAEKDGKALGRDEQEDLIAETFSLCREYESRLSRTIAGSEISRVNEARGGRVNVSEETADLILAAQQYSSLTGGKFDITVGRLEELWNFSGDDPHVPAEADIQAALPHVGYQNIQVALTAETEKSAAAVQLTDPDTRLDLGAIAKGYIEDMAANYLKDHGVESAILDFGGSIFCIGEKEAGKPFTIGIERPFAADGEGGKTVLGSVQVRDQVVVTSGTYERKFYENGVLYHHVLDPQTGYPCETDLDGVTIVGKSAQDCDGLSTSCLLLGLDAGKALIESMPDYEAVFVGKDGKITVTGGLDFAPEE